MITVILNKELGLNKETLISKLSDQNIDSRPFFYPLSMLPAFKELGSVQESQRNNRNSYSISPWGINLPSGLNLTKDQVGYICDKLIKIVKE